MAPHRPGAVPPGIGAAGPPLPPGRLSVDDVARLAAMEGISYGQYSVKHRLYERKR